MLFKVVSHHLLWSLLHSSHLVETVTNYLHDHLGGPDYHYWQALVNFYSINTRHHVTWLNLSLKLQPTYTMPLSCLVSWVIQFGHRQSLTTHRLLHHCSCGFTCERAEFCLPVIAKFVVIVVCSGLIWGVIPWESFSRFSVPVHYLSLKCYWNGWAFSD